MGTLPGRQFPLEININIQTRALGNL
uniref:Uncharacterized protein n=1 Tax=Anguilla anguilla TaxID=7936 RepID=A0A0E9VQB2_ANGAN